jgi:hypothetical protein
MTTQTARPPSKPWRVTWPSVVSRAPHSEDYRSQRAAYEAVASITRQLSATVYHWERGDWRLYERVEPAPRETEEAGQ